MATRTYTGNAIPKAKVVRVSLGASADSETFSDSDSIKIGMGERLIEMAGWHPSDFVDLWNEQSDDPFSDVSIEAGVDDDYLEFTANDVGTDFEIRVLVNNAELDVANEV